MSEHINKKGAAKAEETLQTSETFLMKNKNKIIGAIVALCVIVGGYFCYQHFVVQPNEQKASEALFKGEHYLSMDNYELALNGDSTGYMGFAKIAEKFSSTKAGNLANAYAGICNAHLGKFEEAKKYLENFEAKDELVAPAIMATLGNTYAQLGENDKAIAFLLKAADKADSQALSPIYLIQAGELLEKQGKNTEAIEAYKKVKEKYFNTYQAMEIDKYIERASTK